MTLPTCTENPLFGMKKLSLGTLSGALSYNPPPITWGCDKEDGYAVGSDYRDK